MTKTHTVRLACCISVSALLITACGSKPFDPDCTAEKAARSTAMKATVGVGGRCTPAEAAADTAKRKTGIE